MTQPIQQIPLSKLVASSANVRRTGRSDGVPELAASIAAHGLLQNLTVRRVTKVRARGNAGFATILQKQLDSAKDKAREIDRRYGAAIGQPGQKAGTTQSTTRSTERQPENTGDRRRDGPQESARFGSFKTSLKSPLRMDRRGNRRDTGDNLWGIVDDLAAEVRSTFGRDERRSPQAHNPYPEQFPYHVEYRQRNPHGGFDPREREHDPGKEKSPEEPGQEAPTQEERQQHRRRHRRRRGR